MTFGERFTGFFAQPFKGAQEMSVLDWFLFLGLVIILLAGWRVIFTHIEEL